MSHPSISMHGTDGAYDARMDWGAKALDAGFPTLESQATFRWEMPARGELPPGRMRVVAGDGSLGKTAAGA